jgi:SAM-dependent methyltransferase
MSIDSNTIQYFSYLKKRRAIGFIYRRFYLYPRITKFIKGRVLDVGCGIGDFLSFYKNSIGVDINPLNIRNCRKKKLTAYLIDGEKLPFIEESFESTILDNVLEHINDPYPILREINRVLKNDGVLIVGVPGARGFLRDPDHKKYYDEKLLSFTLSNVGFYMKKTLYMPSKSSYKVLDIKQACIYSISVKKI